MSAYGPYGGGAARFVDDSVSTASPARLVVMLYDRLVLDLDRAEAALATGQSAHHHLLHAQEILLELRASLDTTVWGPAAGLANLYVYCLERLISANRDRDVAIVVEVRDHLQPLREAWTTAAATLATSSVPAGTPLSSVSA